MCAPITTALADLGAEVIKVEPPQGDYVREMTWPIVEGVSLVHLPGEGGRRVAGGSRQGPDGGVIG